MGRPVFVWDHNHIISRFGKLTNFKDLKYLGLSFQYEVLKCKYRITKLPSVKSSLFFNLLFFFARLSVENKVNKVNFL